MPENVVRKLQLFMSGEDLFEIRQGSDSSIDWKNGRQAVSIPLM